MSFSRTTQRETEKEEILALKQEIETFKKEKDRVRAIVGQVGGIPTTNTRILNICFIIFIIGCLFVSLFSGGILRLAMIELAISALSLKMIYLIYNQSRMNHFQLWILTSIEWHVTQLQKSVYNLEKKIEGVNVEVK